MGNGMELYRTVLKVEWTYILANFRGEIFLFYYALFVTVNFRAHESEWVRVSMKWHDCTLRSKFDTTRKNTQRYYTTKRLIRQCNKIYVLYCYFADAILVPLERACLSYLSYISWMCTIFILDGVTLQTNRNVIDSVDVMSAGKLAYLCFLENYHSYLLSILYPQTVVPFISWVQRSFNVILSL